MQVAIDNAKRRFDIDLTKEIETIKKDMNIKENGYPKFWSIIRKGFNKARINEDLICPMNYIFDIEVRDKRQRIGTLPMSDFFVKYELNEDRRKSKKVEELIQKYSLDLYNYNIDVSEDMDSNYLLLRNDFEELVNDIKNIYISKNYLGMMSWLIDRAFYIGSGVRRNNNLINSTINTNKSLLLKVLYDVNKDAFLKCFSKKIMYT